MRLYVGLNIKSTKVHVHNECGISVILDQKLADKYFCDKNVSNKKKTESMVHVENVKDTFACTSF